MPLRISSLLALVCVSTFAAQIGVANDRPNIVLILCDDMGFSDLGCYGGEVETPHLDRLAAEGMRFTQFYNNAKCTTTRASIITGLYPRSEGADPGDPLLRPNMATVAESLGAAGYRTALVGKWHLGRGKGTHPLSRGFDEYYGLLDGACNYFDPARSDPDYKGSAERFFADNSERVTNFDDDFYTTDAFTDRAIEWVLAGGQSGRPFFLHLCYNAPHYPLHAWPEDIAKYRGRYLHGWEDLRRQRFQRQKDFGLFDDDARLSETDSRAYDWETADHEFEDHRMAVYAAMVDRMDQNIGRLLSALESHGAAENTLILFLSDNGGCAEEPGGRDPARRTPGPADDYVAIGPAWGWAQNAPFRRYKTWMHEGGICTPLIAHWRGRIAEGVITRQVGHVIDLAPTLLEVANAGCLPEINGLPSLPMEGNSLMSVLMGAERRRPVEYAWDYASNAAIRAGNCKAVWDSLTQRWELFDLAEDRTETHDLSEGHPERLFKMVEEYNRWADRTENSRRPLP